MDVLVNPMGLGVLSFFCLGGGPLPLCLVFVGPCVRPLLISILDREGVDGLVVAVPLAGFNGGVWSYLPEIDVPSRTP